MSGLTAALARSVERAGWPGGVQYTERQLYYALCRTLRPLPRLTARQTPPALAAGLLPALLALNRPPRAAGLALAGGLAVGALHLLPRLPFTLSPPLTDEQFARALHDERARHGPPPGLLPPPAPSTGVTAGREPDLAAYGLPRLLICQGAAVAQMLLANRFHVELSCAVLSLEAATPLPEPVRAMLARTPAARVYLLHDASPAGLTAATTARARLALPPGPRLRAVGLRPAQALRLHLFARRSDAPPDVATWPGLAPRERDWLAAGWWAEVEAVPPAQLLRALRRLMPARAPVSRRRARLRPAREAGFMSWPDESDQ